MSELYHVSKHWREGQPLLSLQELVNRGHMSEAKALAMIRKKWPEAGEDYLHGDGSMVSLVDNLREAKEVRAMVGGGRIIRVDGQALKEDGLLRRNEEGYPAVRRKIDPEYLLGAV